MWTGSNRNAEATSCAATRRTNPARASSQELTPINYRVAGERRLAFEQPHRVHLLQGRNSTGKSSIAEAIEWVITGRIERLPDDHPYEQVVPYRAETAAKGQPAEAMVRLRREGIKTERVFRIPGKRNRFLDPERNIQSFRLDQDLMERLASADQARRADAFLAGFFPEEREPRRVHAEARATVEHRRRDLAAPMAAWLKQHDLRELPDQDPNIALAELRLCMPDDGRTPLAWSEIALMGRLDMGLQKIAAAERQATRAPIAQRLQELDAAVARLLAGADQMLARIESALAALSGLSGWALEATPGGGDPVQALNDWLDASVLERLVRQRRDMDALHQAASEAARRLQAAGDSGAHEGPPAQMPSAERYRLLREFAEAQAAEQKARDALSMSFLRRIGLATSHVTVRDRSSAGHARTVACRHGQGARELDPGRR